MRKAVAVYHAPEGDSKVAEMGDVTFFDGQPVDLNSEDHPTLIAKLPGNPHFEIEIEEEEAPVQKRGPGRPRKDETRTDEVEA